MENTVIGVYDSYAQAQSAMNELLSAGFPRNAIQLDSESERIVPESGTTEGGTGVGHFFRSLFGRHETHHEHGDIYAEAVRRGSVVLTVDADSGEQREHAVRIMNRHDPVDIDERVTQWRARGWAGYDENAPRYTAAEIEKERNLYYGQSRDTGAAEQTRIPVIEEELKVGKREVERGSVRVYTHLREKPVHETVQLREEHVTVERHAVDQPVTQADLAAFKEGSVEFHEMAEEPVVSKTAHVVEEVVIGKEVSQETASIDDTVRRTDVEVEQLGARGATAKPEESDFRTHWQTAYGQSGGRYEDYDAAYRYGWTMGGSGRYQNYRWEEAEPNLRSDWEAHHPGSAWDKVKDAVRYGTERVTGR